ncbi:unnamed protein product [Malus baccata var. baccata]
MESLEEESLELKVVVGVARRWIKHLGCDVLGLKVEDKKEAGWDWRSSLLRRRMHTRMHAVAPMLSHLAGFILPHQGHIPHLCSPPIFQMDLGLGLQLCLQAWQIPLFCFLASPRTERR